MSRSLLSALILAALLAAPASRADRLHLANGGEIAVTDWWVDNDTLYYRNARGTVGLPRSMVVRIEETAVEGQAPSADAAAVDPAVETRPPGESARPRTYRVPAEVARQIHDARALLEGSDFQAAADLFESAMHATGPEFVPARIGYAVARLALGDVAVAHAVVLDALAHEPDHPELLELWGDLLDREERVEDALDSWRRAFRVAPNDRLRGKILKAERELEAARDYEISASTHFNMRYDGEVDEALAGAVAVHLEQSYWELVEVFDHAPSQPITVVLYPRQEFRDVTQSAEWVGGIYDGKIKVPLGGLRQLTDAAGTVLVHELAHAFVHSKTRGNCPRWLHEGLAQRASGQTLSPADRRQVAERLRQADPADWLQAGFSYPLALSLTNYLASRRGSHGLVDLLEVLAGERDTDAALVRVFGDDYGTLCRAWALEVLEGSGP